MKLKFKFNICDFYIWIYILYYLQDILYPYGIINQFLFIVFLIISIFIGTRYLVIRPSNPGLINITAVLLWMYIIYGLILIFSDPHLIIREKPSTPVINYVYLQNSFISLLPIFTFYYFFKKKLITVEKIRLYVIPLFILAILRYLKNESEMLSHYVHLIGEDIEFTNNMGYLFTFLIPLLMLVKNRIVKYILLIVSLSFILSSFKRGAILTAAISLIYFGYFLIFKSKNLKRKITSIIVVIIVLVSISIYAVNLYNNSEYFKYRIEKTESGDSSNRKDIYGEIWEAYTSGNVGELLVGRGANSTLETADNYAHEDWLETLHNNGLIGFIILLSFYISILKSTVRVYSKVDEQLKLAFGTLFIVCLIPTFFSMSIQNMGISQTILLGLLAFKSRQNFRKIKSGNFKNPVQNKLCNENMCNL